MSVAAKTHLMEILAEGDEYQLLAQQNNTNLVVE